MILKKALLSIVFALAGCASPTSQAPFWMENRVDPDNMQRSFAAAMFARADNVSETDLTAARNRLDVAAARLSEVVASSSISALSPAGDTVRLANGAQRDITAEERGVFGAYVAVHQDLARTFAMRQLAVVPADLRSELVDAQSAVGGKIAFPDMAERLTDGAWRIEVFPAPRAATPEEAAALERLRMASLAIEQAQAAAPELATSPPPNAVQTLFDAY